MAKINIRSPYFVTVDTNDITSAVLDLYIYTGTRVGTMDAITYSLESDAYNGKVVFEISQLIGDYLDVNFNGSYDSQVLWVNYQITESINGVALSEPNPVVQSVAFDGYGFFEDGANPQNNSSFLISNKTILLLDDNNARIPVDSSLATKVSFVNNGEVLYTKSISTSLESDEQIIYVSNSVNGADSFRDRVLSDSGTFEDNECLKGFLDLYSLFPVDKIYVEDANGVNIINVNLVEECLQTPYKLTFINKFGALQDLFMFKRSDLKMQVESEKYRSFLYDGYNYDISQHQYRNLSVSAKQSISLSSGFYPEEYNKVFEQLLLSEKIWIDYDSKILPVNIKSKEMSYKTRLNDKLIDYKFEFDFAFDKINQVY